MKYERPSDIPQAVVDKTKTLRTYITLAERRAFSQDKTLDELDDDDWRAVYWEKSTRRANYYRKQQVDDLKAESVQPVTPEVHKGIEVSDYLEYYTDPAPNDLETIKQLVSMQKQLAQIEDQVADVLSDETINVKRWSDLSRIQKELSTETRQLQEMLNISKRARGAMRQDRKTSDYLMQNIAQAKELMDDYGTKLVCPNNCLVEEVSIFQGFIIHHFPEMGLTVTTRCPTCGQEYTIVRPPVKWERTVEVER